LIKLLVAQLLNRLDIFTRVNYPVDVQIVTRLIANQRVTQSVGAIIKCRRCSGLSRATPDYWQYGVCQI
jgi:hypothetical protein